MNRMLLAFGDAIRSLNENRLRTILSATGVMVGSVAIVLLISIGVGVQADIRDNIDDLGANVIIVLPFRVESGTPNPNIGGQSFLREEDEARLSKLPGLSRTSMLTFVGGGVEYDGEAAYPMTVACEPAWFEMHNAALAEGRYLLPEDDGEQRCVLGGVAVGLLFEEGESPLGKTVAINGFPFEVVGALEDESSEQSLFSMQSFQNVVYVPHATWKGLAEDVQIDRIMLQSEPNAEPEALIQSIEDSLGERLSRQQYSVLTQEDLLGLIHEVMGILGWLLIGLTAIALFVGGLGVMTVMVMSVSERQREIGIRKATGARSSDVFQQFLVESVIIALAGVLVGLAISTAAGAALRAFTSIKPIVTWQIVALAALVGIGLGSLFGLIPAMRAARQDPVVALRNE